MKRLCKCTLATVTVSSVTIKIECGENSKNQRLRRLNPFRIVDVVRCWKKSGKPVGNPPENTQSEREALTNLTITRGNQQVRRLIDKKGMRSTTKGGKEGEKTGTPDNATPVFLYEPTPNNPKQRCKAQPYTLPAPPKELDTNKNNKIEIERRM